MRGAHAAVSESPSQFGVIARGADRDSWVERGQRWVGCGRRWESAAGELVLFQHGEWRLDPHAAVQLAAGWLHRELWRHLWPGQRTAPAGRDVVYSWVLHQQDTERVKMWFFLLSFLKWGVLLFSHNYKRLNAQIGFWFRILRLESRVLREEVHSYFNISAETAPAGFFWRTWSPSRRLSFMPHVCYIFHSFYPDIKSVTRHEWIGTQDTWRRGEESNTLGVSCSNTSYNINNLRKGDKSWPKTLEWGCFSHVWGRYFCLLGVRIENCIYIQ